jgi:Zn-dependent metalloprotease
VGWTAVNASWNGSNTNFGRTQDGLRQATPIDIVAHEYGHAIFQTTPGGSGSGGTGNEKGGLNEATSDIVGALTEAYADNPNDPPDFLVGEQADLVGTGPIRIMYDPTLHGHPGCWSTDIPTTSPVHAAGGPLNKWFYMVSEGSDPVGGPASPICPGGPSSVTGIGIIEAGQVFYNALLMKTTSWRYVNARQASMIAAVSMFGANSAQCTTVRDAWDAVSVPVLPNEPACTTAPPPPPPPRRVVVHGKPQPEPVRRPDGPDPVRGRRQRYAEPRRGRGRPRPHHLRLGRSSHLSLPTGHASGGQRRLPADVGG